MLLVIAVALATALVVTVSTALDSINGSLLRATEDMLGRADLQVRHQTGGRLPEELLNTVEGWPEVAVAAPRLHGSVRVENLRTGESRTFNANGVLFDRERRMHPLDYLFGRPPERDDEIAIDPRVADRLGVEIGDVLRIGDWGREVDLTVVGIHGRVALTIVQRPEIRLSLPLLQEIAGYPARINQIDLALKPGHTADEVLSLHGGEIGLPAELLPSDVVRSGLDRNLRGSRIMYYLAALFAFLSAAFIVLTGMTTAVTQRVRELAMMRCVGASRPVIFLSQIIVGAILGTVGGLAGLPIGLALAGVFYSWYGDMLRAGLVVEPAALLIAVGGAVLAGVGGAALPAWASSRITPLAALTVRARPARTGGLIVLTILGLMAIALQLLLLRTPEDEQVAFWAYVTIGLPAMMVGWFVLSVAAVLLVTALLAAPLSRMLRLPRDMLAGAIRATPYRHGFTAGALMVGLAAMVSIRANGQGILDNWLAPIEFPDAFIESPYGLKPEHAEWLARQPWVGHICPIGMFRAPIAGEVSPRLRRGADDETSPQPDGTDTPRQSRGLNGTDTPRQSRGLNGTDIPRQSRGLMEQRAQPERREQSEQRAPLERGVQLFGVRGVHPQQVHVFTFEPRPFFAMTNLEWIDGDETSALRRLEEGGTILVAREFLTARGLSVGDTLRLGRGQRIAEMEIVGVVSSPGLDIAINVFGIEAAFHEYALHSIFGTRADAARLFDHTDIRLIQFEITDLEMTDEIVRDLIVRNLGPVNFGSGRLIKEGIGAIAGRLMNMAATVALAALLVAALGMANVVAANVAARRFQYGVLRAVGAGRGLLFSLVLAEAIIIGAAACLTGTGLGLHGAMNGAYLYRILLGLLVPPSFPLGPIALGWALVFVFAIGASIPALIGLLRARPCELMGGAAE